MDRNIYTLELHEEISINRWLDATRVAGGWVYKSSCEAANDERTISTVFIPLNNEFQKVKATLMPANKEIDAKIAEIRGLTVVTDGLIKDRCCVYRKHNDIGGARYLYEPSTSLQQAMELAEKYELIIDFGSGLVEQEITDGEFDYHSSPFKILYQLPRAICEVVLLIEGVEL